jgi:hypothetical protein
MLENSALSENYTSKKSGKFGRKENGEMMEEEEEGKMRKISREDQDLYGSKRRRENKIKTRLKITINWESGRIGYSANRNNGKCDS